MGLLFHHLQKLKTQIMSCRNQFLSYLVRMWDPRPMLASEWLEAAEKYEERLRVNKYLNSQVVDDVLQERNRIRALFNALLPEFVGRTSVVVTTDVRVEHCAVFLWNDYLYVLVSAALIGRPFDRPEDTGLKAWEWLARHEIAHIRGGHLPWFFHTRRLFRLTYNFCSVLAILLSILASKHMVYTWLQPFLWLLGGLWVVQTIVALAFEWKADLVATQSIIDPSVLEEAEKSLCRMSLQARGRWPFPLGWIQYVVSMLLVDPHPPLAARRWLLLRSLRALANPKKL